MREYITKFLPFEELVTKDQGPGKDIKVCGIANFYELLDLVGDVVKSNAFAESLENHRKNGTMPLMLFEHKNRVCGKWHEAREDAHGLYVSGVVNNDASSADIVSRIKRGKITGLSIGFNIIASYRERNVRYITKGNLVEISVVGNPANPYSRFIPTNMDVQHENFNNPRMG